MRRFVPFNFYDAWELYWPANVTWGELRTAANEEISDVRHGPDALATRQP